MTAHRHRRHPTELKIRLAESYLNGEGSLKGIAKAHDISHNLLMIWVDKYRRGELSDEVDFVEKQRTYEAHIAALERKTGLPRATRVARHSRLNEPKGQSIRQCQGGKLHEDTQA